MVKVKKKNRKSMSSGVLNALRLEAVLIKYITDAARHVHVTIETSRGMDDGTRDITMQR